ncbi:MAG: isoleucine--tRNA ligase [Candidatus Marsarchaeota archaeon]|nr:isoleucine--tRNA ligase [Candidatus Marsarchaeota archaeon]
MFERPKEALFTPSAEEETLEFWKRNRIFERSVENRRNREKYRFLEGPPTANGLPHHGSIRTRVVKDCVLRYMTMKGKYVPRVAGWDTHGLPVELEVQKELGLKGKEDIEKFGLEKFSEECRRNVFKYESEWRRITERIGFWIDLDHAYVTFRNEYIESVWWSLKTLYDRGLLYKGFKVVPYCPNDQTPLSSHEVAQGYDEADDPSVYVKFRIRDGAHAGEKLVAWTTTPWTLPSNVALAVNPGTTYARVEVDGEVLIVASTLVSALGAGVKLGEFPASELIGCAYDPPFNYLSQGKRHLVLGYDGVTLNEGTGVVHMAPAFGAEDFEVCSANGMAFFQPVDSRGRFTSEVLEFQGLFVKDADKKIISYLREKGLLVKAERVRHTYPFCWRCGSPLLYYAWPTWFVKTTALKQQTISLNAGVHWVPSHVREGRFGEFLNEMVDWALSRNRFWGTPLPVWECGACHSVKVVGSVRELVEASIRKPGRLDLHRPFVDEYVLRCERCGGEMFRDPVVIDVWYDSGSASFARLHYPFENADELSRNMPADFISEGVDQTRGWFYSLLTLSSLLFNQPAYKACLVIGLVLNEKGEKMSKSERNYVDPWTLISSYGADPFRWNLLGSTPSWESIRFGESGVADAKRRFFNIFENSLAFFLTYAELDGFDPAHTLVPPSKRSILDKWLLTKLQGLVEQCGESLDRFEFSRAVNAVERFVVDDLSQWYIRRSRRRFWKSVHDDDKWAAYSTLYDAFRCLSTLIAPIAPFTAERVYRILSPGDAAPSVHLLDYPRKDGEQVFEEAYDEVERVRLVVEALRAARSEAQVKTRQPVASCQIYCDDATWTAVERNMELVLDEVNAKQLSRIDSLSGQLTYDLEPDPSALGRRFKAKSRAVADTVLRSRKEYAQKLAEEGRAAVDLGGESVEVSTAEFRVLVSPKQGYTHSEKGGIHVFIDLSTTPQLEAEGIARDIVRRIQLIRREINLDYDQKIAVALTAEDAGIVEAVNQFKKYIMDETLAASLEANRGTGRGDPVDLDGSKIWIEVSRLDQTQTEGS